jgi:hypothetical protein
MITTGRRHCALRASVFKGVYFLKLLSKAIMLAACCGIAFSVHPAAAAESHAFHPTFNSSFTLGLIELPFLLVAIIYAFRTAGALQGGIFGRGMGLMAGGMVVMAIGHLLMMSDMIFGVNLLGEVFGATLGGILWVVALLSSWGLVGFGFHSIYRASKA